MKGQKRQHGACSEGSSDTYYIRTFGCQQNENDSEIMAGHLEQLGFRPAATVEEADVILLNTCSVREHADDRFFGNLGRLKGLKQKYPDLFIGVGGCIMTRPEQAKKVVKSFPYVNLIFGTADLGRFPDLFLASKNRTSPLLAVGPLEGIAEDLPVVRARPHRALISVTYGCNNFCTYCIVPYTRGRERSRAKDAILRDAYTAVESGHQEIMLLGQNVNSWGNDRNYADGDFASLLDSVANVPGLGIVRFMTSHPKDFSDRLIRVIGENEIVEPHLHLPLQSGSDSILRRMNRKYTREQYLDIVRRVKAARPGITLSTDIIVGFPGETEKDFSETLDIVREVRFDSAFTFIYSTREGTPAAKYDSQIDRQVINNRYQRLIDLQYEISRESNEALIGKTVSVLIEGASDKKKHVMTGRTRDNRLVHVHESILSLQDDNDQKAPDMETLSDMLNLTGQFVDVEICCAGSFALEGVVKPKIKGDISC
jgi:tRNA-2-methylthio-N6-dimethylallyladenosine synthase